MSSIGVDIGASHISCGLYKSEWNKLECKVYFPIKINKNRDINVSTRVFIKLVMNVIDRLIKENNRLMDEVTSILMVTLGSNVG